MSIDQIINGILVREQGYVNNPNDAGGPTKWGITEKVARNNGYTGDMKDLPQEFAFRVLKLKYYITPGFAFVSDLSVRLGIAITDAGVLCGQETVIEWLQTILNALSLNSHAEVKIDGNLGEKSINALRLFLSQRGVHGEIVIMRAFNAFVGHHFVTISNSRLQNRTFTYGWLLNRIDVS